MRTRSDARPLTHSRAGSKRDVQVVMHDVVRLVIVLVEEPAALREFGGRGVDRDVPAA